MSAMPSRADYIYDGFLDCSMFFAEGLASIMLAAMLLHRCVCIVCSASMSSPHYVSPRLFRITAFHIFFFLSYLANAWTALKVPTFVFNLRFCISSTAPPPCNCASHVGQNLPRPGPIIIGGNVCIQCTDRNGCPK